MLPFAAATTPDMKRTTGSYTPQGEDLFASTGGKPWVRPWTPALIGCQTLRRNPNTPHTAHAAQPTYLIAAAGARARASARARARAGARDCAYSSFV